MQFIMPNDVSYTPEEVAKILKISKFTVYEIIKRGELKAYHIGRKVRVEGADIESYKQKLKGVSAQLPDVQQQDSSAEALVICGQDIVLDILTRYLSQFHNVYLYKLRPSEFLLLTFF
ncbi:helix-turn-helix domain protein [Desulfosporosinus acididurans]|uniref:Helix-turn-helix domain protein n=1 Tax=Desulfosporosinus acididurans TaxID=476652 RepID=A0A0J1FL38_9FIRM|nr:helix-turn-helix domain protein [Desulfosporosinus acididurans]